MQIFEPNSVQTKQQNYRLAERNKTVAPKNNRHIWNRNNALQRPVIETWAVAGTGKDRKHMADAMRLIPVNKQKQKKTATGRFAWLHDQLRFFLFSFFFFFIEAQLNGICFAVNNPRPIIDDRRKAVKVKRLENKQRTKSERSCNRRQDGSLILNVVHAKQV